MADRKFKPPIDPDATRDRVIRQRNIAVGLVLAFFAVLFFAITVVKMRHVPLPHKPLSAGTAAPLSGGVNGQ